MDYFFIYKKFIVATLKLSPEMLERIETMHLLVFGSLGLSQVRHLGSQSVDPKTYRGGGVTVGCGSRYNNMEWPQ